MTDKMIVVIGASAGGPRVLKQIFTDLPMLNCSIIVVQHMPNFINESIAQSLNSVTEMEVRLFHQDEVLKDRVVYVVPSEYHAKVIQNRQIQLRQGERVNYVCPAVDVTMLSLHQEPGVRHLGILLTGMGRDGAEGMRHIKHIGGQTIAQNEKTCAIFGMPKEAIETGCVDWVLPPDQIHQKLIAISRTPTSN